MIFCQNPPSLDRLAVTNGPWVFGEAYLLDNKEISHVFLVKNTTDRPITLSQIKVGCPCLVATTKAKLPLRIAAQDVCEITIKVLLDAIPPTKLDKAVLLYAGEEVIGRLIVQGIIVPMASLTPAPLVLGSIMAGTPSAFPLRLTLHPRLRNVRIPTLLSTSPHVTITNNMVEIAPDAPIGPLNGAIRFDVPESDKTPLASVWRMAGITFFGEIKGDIAAEPSTVNFGIVRSGSPATTTREVRLIENVPGALKNLKIMMDSSLSPLLKTEWQEDERRLKLIFFPKIPQGNFQSNITIEIKNGQKLRLAVTAYKV
jgi:hypothetical protein